MSMITLNGTLLNIFKTPARENSDEKDKIQILGDVALPNGEVRKDLMTITVNNVRKFEGKEGSDISLSVGAFAPQKGTVIFFETKV